MAATSTFVSLASAIDEAHPEVLQTQFSKVNLWTVLAPEHDNSCQFPIVEGDTPLIYAARAGKLDAVKFVVALYLDMTEDCKTNQKYSPVASSLDLCGEMQMFGVRIAVVDDYSPQTSPENYAVLKGCSYFDLVDWRNSNNDTALTVACSNGYLQIVTYLLENGVELFQCSCLGPVVCSQAGSVCWHGFKALLQAAKKGQREIIKYLVDAIPDINAKDRHGKKAIFYYTCFTCVEILEAILAIGADTDVVTSCGWTALMMAVVIHKHEMVECLCRFGANPNHFDARGNNALLLSLQWSNEPLQDVKTLLKHGARTTVKNWARYTPLMCAQSAELVDVLVQYGAKICVDLHFAVMMDRLSVVQAMIRHGAAPFVREVTNLPDCIKGLIPSYMSKLSPLHAAVLCGCLNIVQYFISIWFFTESDLSQLFWDRSTLELAQERFGDEFMSVLHHHRSCPASLAVQCLVGISAALGEGPDRQARVKHLRLPYLIQRKLLCFDEDIPRTFFVFQH